MSEQEICKRVAGGEWPLVVYVRPESSAVYRPLLWMLPKWTSDSKESEHTIIRGNEPMHEMTRIASSAYLENLLPKNSTVNAPASQPSPSTVVKQVSQATAVKQAPPAPPAMQPPPAAPAIPLPPPDWGKSKAEQKSEQKPAELEFSVPRAKKAIDDLSGQAISFADLSPLSPFSQTPATPVSLQPRMRDSTVEGARSENSVIRAATAAIVEGERQTREFEKRKSTGGADAADFPQALQVGQQNKDPHLSVQSPAHASEGMVSLVDHESATQIKFRRLNPTAPRKRGRSGSRRTLDKGPVNSLRRILINYKNQANFWTNPMTIAVIAIAVIMVVVTGVFIYDKRQRQSDLREQSSQQIAEREQGQSKSSSGGNSSEEPTTDTRKKKKKKLNARPLDAGGGKSAAKVPNFFKNSAELSRYLSSSESRGFIRVGPVKLQKPVSTGCSPCRMSGKLSDGSSITLVSVIDRPFKAVVGDTVVYAIGFLTENENGKYILTVNTLSGKPY